MAMSPEIVTLGPIPERLEGEPPPEVVTMPVLVAQLIGHHLLILFLLGMLPFWGPLYGLGWLIWGRPPIIPPLRQFSRYLGQALTAQPPPPGLSVLQRYQLVLTLLRILLTSPMWGLAWYLDELLYARALRDVKVVAPLFEISAARSGSTQLARYLEDDPHIVTPSALQCFFPIVWLWKLAPVTVGRILTQDKVREKMHEVLPEAWLQRHEMDPYRTDTFEVTAFALHLLAFAMILGPDMMRQDISNQKVPPHLRWFWEGEFPRLVEAMARKTLYHAGPLPDGSLRRFMVKGHFLAGASALEKHFPDATFLTVTRVPDKRLQSFINYMHVGPAISGNRPIPFEWLVEFLVQAEIEYCENEQAWFTQQTGARKCVIKFDDYVKDLEGTMKQVYQACFGVLELPPHVPRAHAPRQRTHYHIDRSLEQLGINGQALNARLANYVAWCKGGR